MNLNEKQNDPYGVDLIWDSILLQNQDLLIGKPKNLDPERKKNFIQMGTEHNQTIFFKILFLFFFYPYRLFVN